MKPLAALAISATMLFAQTERAPVHSVTAVRNWSLGDVTRIAIEVTGDFNFRSDRLHNPERIYFDILNARPRIDAKRIWSKAIDDPLVQRVRVAETQPGTTRVVVDLSGPVEVSTSQLSNPSRLMIELRAGRGPAIPTGPMQPVVKPPPVIRAESSRPVEPPGKPAEAAPPLVQAKPETPDLKAEADPLPVKLTTAAPPKTKSPLTTSPLTTKSKVAPAVAAGQGLPAEPAGAAAESRGQLADLKVESPSPALSASPAPPAPSPASPGEFSKGARRTSTGGSSLTRALGLKVGRIVIDAGHGGHDQGTQGPHGLVEKELVLDVAQRVGKLIEERMNAEVIYTRSDDTFVPLEGRTAIANQKKADLFLSIHANSSPIPRIAGMETFYLNFTDSRDALDVASRENASSQKSIFELQDIIQKITLHEKLDESREFASRIQTALFGFSSRNIPGQKNRGVKKAPFVVLIGASMPSVLAEIGFLSNPREESLLKKSDYRQKLAESLYRGVAKYAESLSHFQMAAN
jgi:N-acetylmuramoyl-L-alanine amidase